MHLSDDQLISAYLRGQDQAFQKVDSWIERVVNRPQWGLFHEREDILQEVRRRVFMNLQENKFRGDSCLKTYVYKVAKFTCIEFLRDKVRRAQVDLEPGERRDPSPGPEELVSAAEQSALIASFLERLPESHRVVFQMVVEEQLDYRAVSERLAIAQGTVKSRLSRCRSRLAQWLSSRHRQTVSPPAWSHS